MSSQPQRRSIETTFVGLIVVVVVDCAMIIIGMWILVLVMGCQSLDQCLYIRGSINVMNHWTKDGWYTDIGQGLDLCDRRQWMGPIGYDRLEY